MCTDFRKEMQPKQVVILLALLVHGEQIDKENLKAAFAACWRSEKENIVLEITELTRFLSDVSSHYDLSTLGGREPTQGANHKRKVDVSEVGDVV
ncbi:hypothetical protein ANCCAN_17417 [Ancylostoma caninum]|uniref:Uncharacterized protein n=1 Tax=Ancylostoma caninum TaxID=29170 RepID=A0A368FX72_ANCCA|nr:hypothetical protein ANCCAN_17417 [Ancylostoma caninum]